MLTQEQAKQMACLHAPLASSYASIAGANEATWAQHQFVGSVAAKKEKQAWEKLDGYVVRAHYRDRKNKRK
jgi:hypothetical protein